MRSSLPPGSRARTPSPSRRGRDATIDGIAQTLVPGAPVAPTPVIRAPVRPAAGSGADDGASRRPDGADEAAAGRRRSAGRWSARAATAVVVVGAAVRIEQFGWRRSLWLDEALVTANIVGRGFRGLAHPLAGQQGAPVGWLWAERMSVLVFGNNEYGLRVVPLVAGIGALALVWAVARRLLGPWPSVLAVGVIAASPSAVRYSVEVKQYSSDLAIALGLTLLALRVGTGRSDSRAAWVWGGAGAAAVWCSHAAVLVMVGTAAALGLAALLTGDRRRAVVVVAASCPWGLSFAADWWVSLRPLGHNSFLHAYWAAGFAPAPLAPRTLIPWLARTPVHLVRDPGGLPVPLLTAAVLLAGIVVVAARRPAPGAVLVFPAVVGLTAATAGRYPLLGRMALWLLPVLAVALAGAAAALAAEVARRAPDRPAWAGGMAAAVAVSLLLVPAARQVGRVAHDPTTWSDVRPLLQAVHARLEPGEVLWAHSNDAPSATYYAVATGVPLTAAVYDGAPGAVCPGQPDLAGRAAGRRVWLVYGYHASTAPAAEEAAVNARFATLAHLVGRIARPQATAWLWDFGAVPDAVTVPPAARVLGCVGVVPLSVRPTGLGSRPFGTGHAT